MKPAQPKTEEPVNPGVIAGDEVFFHAGTEHQSGKVLCCGKHGATIQAGEQQHKVKWDRILGHKKRAKQRYVVIEEGEDGYMIEDANGSRRYLGVANVAKQDPLVTKAFVDGRWITLAKAKS